MDQQERSNDFIVAIDRMLEGWQSNVWTAIPGTIVSYNSDEKSASVQPSIKALVTKQDGTTTWVNLPILLDCPVHFPSGGGFSLTFPIAEGDECLVVFSSRCIDAWWQSGGSQVQAETRMHDLSDGFVFVGFSSIPNVTPNISADSVQLRSEDGSSFVEITASGDVNLKASGNISMETTQEVRIKATSLELDGDLNCTGEGTFNNGANTVGQHRHAGGPLPTG